MIRHKIILCAQGVVVDKKSNNISIFNIIDEISPRSFPAIVARLTILSVLERDADDPNEFDSRLHIAIGDRTILDQIIHYSFENTLRTRNIIEFGGMPLPQPGLLTVTIFKDDTRLQEYQIQIIEPAQPERLE
jgi:hypothetical protein